MNAQDYVIKAEAKADELNKQRPLWKKILRKDVITPMEILYNTAACEYRCQLEYMFDGVMSIPLWENITKKDFLKLLSESAHEVARERKDVTEDDARKHYKDKTMRFAQWLEDTKHRPFFMGSFHEIENVIRRIRSLVS